MDIYELGREIGAQLARSKDCFQALQALVAAVALPLAALWAWQRFRKERPLEPSLTLELAARRVVLSGDEALLHLELHLKNVGRAAFHICPPGSEEYHPWIRVYRIKAEHVMRRSEGGWVDWDNVEFAEKLFDGWFTDAPNLILESGEVECFAAEIPISPDVNIVNVWVKIWERGVKNFALRRPYFWSAQQLFDLVPKTPAPARPV